MVDLRHKIGLGTVQFGLDYGISNSVGMTPISQVKKILRYASGSGVNLIDTAPSYGQSEATIGQCLKVAHNYKIVTKINPLNQIVIDNEVVTKIGNDFYKSLTRLQVKSIYGLLFHNTDDLRKEGIDKVFEFLHTLKQQKYIEKIGVSVYEEDQIRYVLDRFELDLIQVPINIFDQRLHRSGVLKTLSELKVEIHSRSAFMQGIMFMDPKEIPNDLKVFKPKVERLNEFALDSQQTIAQIALNYLICQPEINNVLIGCNNLQQLKQIMECCKSVRNLPNNLLNELSIRESKMLNPTNW